MNLDLDQAFPLDIEKHYNLLIARSKLTYTRKEQLTYVQKENDIISNGQSVGKDYIPVPFEPHPKISLREPTPKQGYGASKQGEYYLKELMLATSRANRERR